MCNLSPPTTTTITPTLFACLSSKQLHKLIVCGEDWDLLSIGSAGISMAIGEWFQAVSNILYKYTGSIQI